MSKETNEEYRKLTVQKARTNQGRVYINFRETRLCLVVSTEWLKKHNIKLSAIKPGANLMVQGKIGNDDASLWRYDPVKDMMLVSH